MNVEISRNSNTGGWTWVLFDSSHQIHGVLVSQEWPSEHEAGQDFARFCERCQAALEHQVAPN